MNYYASLIMFTFSLNSREPPLIAISGRLDNQYQMVEWKLFKGQIHNPKKLSG